MLLRPAFAVTLLWFAQPAAATPECHQGETAGEHAAHVASERREAASSDRREDAGRAGSARRQQARHARRARAERSATSCGIGEDPFAMAPGPR